MALCQHLDCAPDDLSRESYDHYGLALYSGPGGEYAVGTDIEADDAAAVNIRDSAWAFNASFLSDFTGLPEEVFTALQPQCEGCNDAILALINHDRGQGFKDFVEEAVSADGREHFLSGYDGEENEEILTAPQGTDALEAFYEASNGAESVTLYIYRTN
jgi:hypothetical protein